VPAVAAVIAAIAIPQYRPAQVDHGQLSTIGTLAGDVDDSFIGTVAVLLVALLVLTGLAVVYSAVDRHPKAVLVTTILASLVIADWLVLWLAVNHTGGSGTFGGTEYDSTLRIVAVPIAATFALLTARAIRQTDDWSRA
jgi:hypothetical protein